MCFLYGLLGYVFPICSMCGLYFVCNIFTTVATCRCQLMWQMLFYDLNTFTGLFYNGGDVYLSIVSCMYPMCCTSFLLAFSYCVYDYIASWALCLCSINSTCFSRVAGYAHLLSIVFTSCLRCSNAHCSFRGSFCSLYVVHMWSVGLSVFVHMFTCSVLLAMIFHFAFLCQFNTKMQSRVRYNMWSSSWLRKSSSQTHVLQRAHYTHALT